MTAPATSAAGAPRLHVQSNAPVATSKTSAALAFTGACRGVRLCCSEPRPREGLGGCSEECGAREHGESSRSESHGVYLQPRAPRLWRLGFTGGFSLPDGCSAIIGVRTQPPAASWRRSEMLPVC